MDDEGPSEHSSETSHQLTPIPSESSYNPTRKTTSRPPTPSPPPSIHTPPPKVEKVASMERHTQVTPKRQKSLDTQTPPPPIPKKGEPQIVEKIVYVDKIVEKIVKVPVEKIVEKIVTVEGKKVARGPPPSIPYTLINLLRTIAVDESYVSHLPQFIQSF